MLHNYKFALYDLLVKIIRKWEHNNLIIPSFHDNRGGGMMLHNLLDTQKSF